MTPVEKLKIELYDILEQQAMLSNHNQQLEQAKKSKLEELDKARRAELPKNEKKEKPPADK